MTERDDVRRYLDEAAHGTRRALADPAGPRQTSSVGRTWWWEDKPLRWGIGILVAAVLLAGVAGYLGWLFRPSEQGDRPPGLSERKLLLLFINRARSSEGLAHLRHPTALSSVADADAERVSDLGDPDEAPPIPPLDLRSFDWRREAELHAGQVATPPGTIQGVFQILMADEEHRDALLDPDFDTVGVGIERRPTSLWVTVILLDVERTSE